MVAAKIANFQKGGDRGNQHTGGKVPIGTLPPAKAAEMLSVSERTVKRAAKVIKHGDLKLIGAVESGEVTVSAAAQHVAAVTRYPDKAKEARPWKAAPLRLSHRRRKLIQKLRPRTSATRPGVRGC
jgi:hypothetical protein